MMVHNKKKVMFGLEYELDTLNHFHRSTTSSLSLEWEGSHQKKTLLRHYSNPHWRKGERNCRENCPEM